MFTPVYAETVRETLTDDTNQPTVATSPQSQVEQVQTGDTPPLLSSFPAFPSAGQTDSSLTTSQAGTTLIRITDAGFDPPTLSVFGPTDVTWVNETAATHTLRGGEPGTAPGSGKIFLPLITKGSPSAVAAAMTYLEELRRQANNLSDFSATLAPGQSFTYRFTEVGQHKFYLVTAPQFSGQLTLSGTAILRTSPSNGEDGVASTRETILEFSGALDPATVTANAFTAKVGAQTLDYRLNLSPDRTRVTLFYKEALPGSTRVRVTIDGNQLKDAQGNGVDVDGDGAAGGNALLEFDTLSLTVVPGTKVCGRVFASELAVTASNVSVNTPLAGVKISVAGRDADLKTTTDANGNFCLDPAPSGRFFVHIDGRTATNGVPAGAYYPFVGKLWQSTPGQQTNVGDAYLPLVVPGTLQTVSADADTLITFPTAVLQGHPEFEGVMITVPANALFNDDGSRGGKVGIAPVPPDRLPGRLPEGLNFPVVITVQTDGAENFDTPAPVCFPNLPDKTTGQPLPAGSKSALWSFDHDKGDWTIVGPMTVSTDGKMVCSDAGVGIRAPGWHGSQPGSTGKGGGGAGNNGNEISPCARSASGLGKEIPDCILNISLGAGLDAAKALSWPISCGISTGAAILDTLGDCIINPNGCFTITGPIVSNGGYLAMGCVPGWGTRSAILSCMTSLGLGTNDVKKQCFDAGRLHASDLQSPFQSLDEIGDLYQDLSIQEGIITSVRDLYILIFGDAIWIESNNGENLNEFLDMIKTASMANSPEGYSISSAEQQALLMLTRPPELSEQVVLKFVNRHNLTYSMYIAGTPTHQSAGRSDFIDINEWISKQKRVVDALKHAQAVGWLTPFDSVIDLANGTFVDRLVSILITGDHYRYVSRNVFFSLEASSQIILRGKTNDSGQLSNLILAPNTLFKIKYYDPTTKQIATTVFTSGDNGSTFDIPSAIFVVANTADNDADNLTNEQEAIVGTNIDVADTDNDGVSDGAEIQNGTNPLDGFAAQTGIIGSADTPGTAVDICVTNDLAVIADGDKGVAIFNIFDNKNPTLVAQVDTPGNAQRVACADGYVAVADDSSGVAVIDIRQVAAARIVQQVTLDGKVTAVAMAGNTVYAGDETGRVVALDLATGAIRAEQNVSVRINDLALAGDYLYLLANDNKLHVLHPQEELRILNTLATPAAQGANLRLFVGTGVAYTTHNRGYNSYNLATPEQPTLIAEGRTDQFGWRQMVSNGAGEGVAIVGVNSNSNRNVLLYDTTDPAQTNAFLTQFDTPGDAQAVVLYKGQAYVADGQAGLQVINYLSYDSQRTAPTLSLTSPFAGDRAEENKLTRFTAVVNDDVQVRQVEFYIDGVLAATDGSYPFEHRLVTPRMTNQASFTLRARAVDTGGNERWSDQQTLTLVPDATAPRIIGYASANATNPADSVRAIAVTFSEAINQGTLTADTLKLFAAGADNLLNTADDTLVTGGTLAFDTQSNQASLTFGSPLSAGIYRAIVSTAISDPAGNRLAADFAWEFGVGQRIPIGSIIAGEISVAGEQDVYNFVATARQWVYFDDQNASRPAYFYWKLQDSSGKQIFQDTIDGSDPGAHLLELGGNYTLTIWGYRETTGAYQFQLRSNPPDTFAIDIGAVIKNGQPGAGAGNIELPGNGNKYTFVATANQWVYFDDQNSSRSGYFAWDVYDPSGKRVFLDYLDDNDPGAHQLTLAGEYTIYTWAYANVAGTYQFQLRSNPPDTFAINIGDVIQNGQPGTGAGNIELPGNGNKYTFNATANQWVYFDDQNSSRSGYFAWDVYDPSGKRVFLDYLDGNDPGAHQLTLAGEYTIYTWAYANVAGTYQFQLRSNPPDTFVINIGDVVRDGQPGVGAGNIELPGNTNKYTFNATANQWVYFDDQNSSRSGYFAWDVYDPSGKRVFFDYLDDNDPGAHQLTVAGEYTIYTWAYANVAGTYQFQLRSNPADTFAINIGDVVRDGQPGAGAGNIELPGNTNQYTFNAIANQRVYFDDQNASRPGYFAWDVYDPTGKRLFFDYLDGNDPGVHQLAMAGTYTIYTWAYANVAGTYQFQLRANSPDEFTINLGDIVKDAQPGPGAGRIELPGNVDIYRFQAAAGQQVYFDEQGSSDIYDFFWRVVDANGQEVFYQYLHEDDAGARVLALGGTYTIYVWASNNIAGTYQFQIRSPVAAEIAIEGKSAEDLAVEAEEKRKAEEEEQNEEIFLPFIGR
jgi:plastocyanin